MTDPNIIDHLSIKVLTYKKNHPPPLKKKEQTNKKQTKNSKST